MRLDVLEAYIPYEKDKLSNVLIINNDKKMPLPGICFGN